MTIIYTKNMNIIECWEAKQENNLHMEYLEYLIKKLNDRTTKNTLGITREEYDYLSLYVSF